MKDVTIFPRSMNEQIRIRVTDFKADEMVMDLRRPDSVFTFDTDDEIVYVPVRAVMVMSVRPVKP
jgi:hypothetical protein